MRCRVSSSTASSTSSSKCLPCRTSAHAGDAEPVQRARDGLALRVEDLGLGHHVHHDSGHGDQPTAWCGRAGPCRSPTSDTRACCSTPARPGCSIDPGNFSTGFEDVTGLDAVLVTHQHPDHLDPERLPALLRANPDARLIVDSGTAGQLGRRSDHEVVEPGRDVDARRGAGGGARRPARRDPPRHPGDPEQRLPRRRHAPASRRRADPCRRRPVEVLFLPTAAPWQSSPTPWTTCARSPRAPPCRSTRGSSRCRACTTGSSSASARSRPRCGCSTRRGPDHPVALRAPCTYVRGRRAD